MTSRSPAATLEVTLGVRTYPDTVIGEELFVVPGGMNKAMVAARRIMSVGLQAKLNEKINEDVPSKNRKHYRDESIFIITDTNQGRFEQTHDGGERFLARQAAASQIACDAPTDFWKGPTKSNHSTS